MDVAKLFDSVLLHEMTHSDVVGVPQAILRIAEEYGWNACTSNKNPANSGTCGVLVVMEASRLILLHHPRRKRVFFPESFRTTISFTSCLNLKRQIDGLTHSNRSCT